MAEHEGERGSGRPVSARELIALNEEIVALVRAGSPLEAGLGRLGDDLSGRLGEVAGRLSDRMGRGESLVDALAAEQAAIPPLYRSIVEAGARAGDVGAALEGVSRYLRGYEEARDAVGLALWYPLVVATMAYALFVGLATLVAPRFRDAFESLGLPATRSLEAIDALGRTAWLWWPIWPIALAFVGVAWARSGRASHFAGGSWTFLGVFPWMRSLVRDYQAAGFAELTALLLENRVAYPRAVSLAAEATGDARLIDEARAISAHVERGGAAAEAVQAGASRAFSPMLRWALAYGQSEGSIVQALRSLAPMYRTRAAFKAEKVRQLLPSVLVVVVGASAALLYALTLFLPLTGMLKELAGP